MKYNDITNENALEIYNECQQYFKSQKTYSINFRITQLIRLRNAVDRYERSILKALYKDLGKCEFEGYATEVGFVKKSIREAIRNLRQWSKEVPVKTPIYLLPAKSKIVYEPYGTVLIMAPFNYPFQLLIEPLIGAISAGNCVVLKPSELAPWTSMVISKMISETFPPRYIRCVEGSVGTNQALLQVPFQYIFFTGSIPVGKLVMEAASKHLTPVTLELGGKSPVIVDKSANLKWAANRIIWGKLLNAGQTCIAPDYVLVHSAVKKEFLEELKACITSFFGDNPKESNSYGRIINERHFERLTKMIEADSEFILSGGTSDATTRYIEPTLLDLPTRNAATMQEEIFGPILPILTYHHLEDVTEIIATMPTPLALYLFTKNRYTKDYVTKYISSGGVCINDTIEHIVNPNLPFGGIGTSGMGSYHGEQSFKVFSHSKSILSRIGTVDVKFMTPPYTSSGLKLLKTIFK